MRSKIFGLLIVIMFILQACAPQKSETTFNATNGVMNLAEWNSDTEVISLSGQWEMYWEQLIEPEDFTLHVDRPASGTFTFPGFWDNYDFNGTSLPKKGYATFRLHISSVPLSDSVLGLNIPHIDSSYKLWIDNQLITTVGKVGTNAKTSAAKRYPRVVFFTPKHESFTITLQISNHEHLRGGMWKPIEIGTAESIHKQYIHQIILQSLLLGILILAGIYHIGLGVFRKSEASLLYFGVFCLVAAFRNLMVGDIFFTKFFPDVSWEFEKKLNYISLYLHVPLLAMVLYRLYSNDFPKWFIKLSIIVPISFSVITIFTKAITYTAYLKYFQVFIIFCSIFALYGILKSLKRRLVETKFLIVGIVSLLMTVIVDVFNYIIRLLNTNLYLIGLTVFIICFSFLLSRKLSSSLELSEALANDLVKLNNDLELKVEQRTEQYQLANEKLEQLNKQLEQMALLDGLTNIPNRRSFENYYEQAYNECLTHQKPITVLLCDIDFFKNYNDRYGHQEGDTCLKRVAEALRSMEVGFVARYGGEEFVSVLTNINQQSAEDTAHEMNVLIEQMHIPHEKSSTSEYVTISIGVATVIPTENTDRNELLKQADEALYKAKRLGKNRYSL
ncbi:diguanylate cyclase [Metabacillus malikii]|uniref:Diguanylate cyclase (GGDEF)-like protein n=1 Tax=Metabacillus malikii TaxID=1504265 RepID=A0ABT9ZHQ0_9BACI|nr:diguanylate cyclase [Metabacillus malikii]MDQ0231797.1 diguanylate cyclase (GGDEF)-like protein [Metabacillus malikii]